MERLSSLVSRAGSGCLPCPHAVRRNYPILGNIRYLVEAVRPAIVASRDPNADSFYFLADYHALINSKGVALPTL